MISNKFNSIRSIISNNISSFKLYSPITIRNNKLINNRLFNSSISSTHSTSTSTTTSTSIINKISYFNNNGRSINNISIKLNNNNTNHNILKNRYFTTTTEESIETSTETLDYDIKKEYSHFYQCMILLYGVLPSNQYSFLIQQAHYFQKKIIKIALEDHFIFGDNDKLEYLDMYWKLANFITNLLNKSNETKTENNNISMEEVEQIYKIINLETKYCSIDDTLDLVSNWVGKYMIEDYKYIDTKLIQLAVKELRSLSKEERQKQIEKHGSYFFKSLRKRAFLMGLWQEGNYLKSFIDDDCCPYPHGFGFLMEFIFLEEVDLAIIDKIITDSTLQSSIPSDYLFVTHNYQVPKEHYLTSSFQICDKESFGRKELVTKIFQYTAENSKDGKCIHGDGLKADEILKLNYGNLNRESGYYIENTLIQMVILSKIVKVSMEFGNLHLDHTGIMNHDLTKCVLVSIQDEVESIITCDVKIASIGNFKHSIQFEGTQKISLYFDEEYSVSIAKVLINVETYSGQTKIDIRADSGSSDSDLSE